VVVGTSRSKEKAGYQVFKTLREAGYMVYPVNPSAEEIDGQEVYPYLDNIPARVDCLVTVVPPAVTESVMLQAGRLKIPYAWMQPGSESDAAVTIALAQGIRVVYGGPCIMVAIALRRRRGVME
jgi:hypothetical protein